MQYISFSEALTGLDITSSRPAHLDRGLSVILNVLLGNIHRSFSFNLCHADGKCNFGSVIDNRQLSQAREKQHIRNMTYWALISVSFSLLWTFMLTIALNSPPSMKPFSLLVLYTI